MCQMEAPSLRKIVKLVFLRKPDAANPKRDQELQGHCAHICIFEVVRVLYFSSLGAREGTRQWEEITRVVA